jgi:glycine dehydrogenase subunit 1
MDFVANKEPQIQAMLQAIGISSIDELFVAIPDKLKRKAPTQDDGLSEFEGMRLIEKMAAKNTFPFFENYLGAGAYEHHIPALVGAICSKSEFLTAYTPYQAEASQGMLQAIFEYQSAICALTGLDVANASVYDGASACAEALLMALRSRKDRKKVLVSEAVHPHYRGVIQQYLQHQGCEIELIPFDATQRTTLDQVQKQVDAETAAILVQSPNFFGAIEAIQEISHFAHEQNVLTILCANPLAYGLYPSAAELGVDIAVGDCQPLGLPMQFGGPYVGYMACRQELIRQLPGRLVGETVDTEQQRGFVLTLQAREQHIRRDKATSNICTNQALAALASLVAILYYGPTGLKELALTNYQRAAYLRHRLAKIKGVKIISQEPLFNEFVVQWDHPIEEVQKHFRQHGIEPGLALGSYFPFLKSCLLVAVTETKDQELLNRYVQVAQEIK